MNAQYQILSWHKSIELKKLLMKTIYNTSLC
jgi:hypothetical protein